MAVTHLIESWGEPLTLTVLGLLCGLLFGSLAQQSRFCLRAATVEVGRGGLGPRFAIWLIAFGAAVAATQAFDLWGALELKRARQLVQRGSLSGALIGGAMFGAGMVLARGCASRLLVLSATGNLRALISGLVVTLVAQASLRGILAPSREWVASLWTIDGGPDRSILALVGGGAGIGLLIGIAWLVPGIWLAARHRVSNWQTMAAAGVGGAVAASWLATSQIARVAFEPVAVKSISFTGPSADTLMALINTPALPWGFDLGLIPGVFLGSLIAAVATLEFELQGFEGGASMVRYIVGAMLMGFGSMLAGGCAVGAGMSGGAVFALTSWLALVAMWCAAMATDRLVDRVPPPRPASDNLAQTHA